MIDLTDMTDEELVDLLGQTQRELSRRREAERIAESIDALVRDYAGAAGRDLAPGSAWERPTSIVDSYPLGSEVTHAGKLWRSLTSANTWEPGVAGWRAVSEEGEPAEWVQPSSVVDAYQIGERVTFEGEVWVSIIANNTWSPEGYPAGWERVEMPDPETEPEPETDPEPEPEPEPGDGGEEEPEPVEPPEDEAISEWVQPTGTHDAYQLGEKVTHSGSVWVSVHDGANTWEPGVWGWELAEGDAA